jgi:transposase
VLLTAQGRSGVEIAERIGYTVIQVSRIRRRFAEGGLAGLFESAAAARHP